MIERYRYVVALVGASAALLGSCGGSSESSAANGGGGGAQGGGAAGASATGSTAGGAPGGGAAGASATGSTAGGGAVGIDGGAGAAAMGGNVSCLPRPAGSAGAGGHFSGPGGATPTGVLGSTCLDDSDCNAGMFCVPSTSDLLAGGGPSNGMCVADCSLGPGACATIDPTAVCVLVSGVDTPRDTSDDVSYCLPTCAIGDTSDLANKCAGRLDMACTYSSGLPLGFGYCWPTCRNDLECGARTCDLGTGLCTDPGGVTGALPMGSPCTTNAECDGLCLDMGGVGMCSGLCSLGSAGCGDTWESMCLFGEVDSGDIGDSAFCAALCDCNDECAGPGFVCEPIDGIDGLTGRRGICFPADQGGGVISSGTPCCN